VRGFYLRSRVPLVPKLEADLISGRRHLDALQVPIKFGCVWRAASLPLDTERARIMLVGNKRPAPPLSLYNFSLNCTAAVPSELTRERRKNIEMPDYKVKT